MLELADLSPLAQLHRWLLALALIVSSGRLVSAAQTPPDVGHAVVSDLQVGKYGEAMELLTRALKDDPRNARLWTLKGLTLIHLGKSAEALTSFNRGLQLAPDYFPALEGAAQIEFEIDDARAVPLLKRILAVHPDDRTAHALLATVAFKHGDCETARDEFAASQISSGETGSMKEFGACLVAHERNLEAVPVFRRLAELQPGDEAARLDLATIEFLVGNYRDVIAILGAIVTRDPENADAQELLGEAYEATLDKDKALSAMRLAISISPNASKYYVDFGYLCLAQHEFQEGIDMLNTGLSRLPDAASLYVARGILFGELAQYDKAEQDFQAAEGLNPNIELVSAARALTELQENDLPKAEKTVRERLETSPNDPLLHYLLAEVLTKQGVAPGSQRFQEALHAALTSVELKPNLGAARNVLARLYLDEGEVKQAAEQSQFALRLNPNDETALYHLILALRRANKGDEVPALLHRLAALKQLNRPHDEIQRRLAAMDKDRETSAMEPP